MLRLVLIATLQGMGFLLLGIGGMLGMARQAPATSSWIAFVSYRDGDGEIYLMRSDGTGQRRLTYRRGDDYAPGWLDQDTLFFLGNLQTLYCLNLDRSDDCPINQRSMTRSSTLSPDGQWLLTLSNTEGNWEIYLSHPGGTRQKITDNPYTDGFPAWSADGEWIAYGAENAQGEWDVYRVRRNGTDRQQLTNAPGHDWQPAWSPLVDLPLREGVILAAGIILLLAGIIFLRW